MSHEKSVNKNFSYRISGNFTYAKNEVEYMDETPWSSTDDGVYYDRSYMNQTGRPMGSSLYYHAIGLFKTQEDLDNYPRAAGQGLGDLIYEDIDKDGKITSNDRYRSPYNTIPQIVYGVTFEARWKAFDFMVLFQGQGRARLYLSQNDDPAVGNITKDLYEGSWSTANPDANKPKLQSSYVGACDYYLKKANFIRLKNVEIGYTFKNEFFHKMGVASLRFYVGGYNLFTISPLKEIDPETNSSELQAYPQVRVFNTGVKFTF